jgi:hypothetical protein
MEILTGFRLLLPWGTMAAYNGFCDLEKGVAMVDAIKFGGVNTSWTPRRPAI